MLGWVSSGAIRPYRILLSDLDLSYCPSHRVCILNKIRRLLSLMPDHAVGFLAGKAKSIISLHHPDTMS